MIPIATIHPENPEATHCLPYGCSYAPTHMNTHTHTTKETVKTLPMVYFTNTPLPLYKNVLNIHLSWCFLPRATHLKQVSIWILYWADSTCLSFSVFSSLDFQITEFIDAKIQIFISFFKRDAGVAWWLSL